MATGSGKTFTAVNFIYRLVKYGGARRVLFLVDRGNLGEQTLKELEARLRENHAAWTEDRLWDAFAQVKPGKVNGRSQAGRFADLVALVRFALEQQPVLKPFAESVHERFNEWLMDKAKARITFTSEQLAWLNLIRDHIATSCSIEPDDFDYAPFSQQGGLGKAPNSSAPTLPDCLANSTRCWWHEGQHQY